MKVKNISLRGWHVGSTLIAPLDTATIDDKFYNDVKDNPELEVTKGGDKKLTKKELELALTEAHKAVDDAILSGDEEAVKLAELALAELQK